MSKCRKLRNRRQNRVRFMPKEPKPKEQRPPGRPAARSGKIDATPEEVARVMFARRSPPPKKDENAGEDR